MPPCRHGSGIWHRRPRGAADGSPPTLGTQSKPETKTERWRHASLGFIGGQSEAAPRSPVPSAGHTGVRRNHRGLGAGQALGARRQAGRLSVQVGVSVELDGAAVVLAVLALLLRGAHEAAQKVAWKQAPIRGPDPPPPPSAPPDDTPDAGRSHGSTDGGAETRWPRARERC